MLEQPKTIVAVFAHPDDESLCSGTLARYADAGHHVALVCATRGEVGEIADPSLATAETLGAVREQELRNAAEALGIQEVIFLGYRDSGMADTPPNAHPEAFINIPAETVVGELVAILRRLRPAVVLTFDASGGYGHPDHIAIHKHTVSAFHAAADAQQFTNRGAAFQPARLFYPTFRKAMFREMRDVLASIGADTSMFAELANDSFWHEPPIHAALDVSAYVEAKKKAFLSHRTQFGENHPFRLIPPEALANFMRKEYYQWAWPIPNENVMLEDLLE